MDIVKDIMKTAREQGWRVDHRAWRNNLARLRRAGLIWPWAAT